MYSGRVKSISGILDKTPSAKASDGDSTLLARRLRLAAILRGMKSSVSLPCGWRK